MERRNEPAVECPDGIGMFYSDARRVWEAGEFSDWVEQHGGLPIIVDGDECRTWDEVEDSLSDDSWDEEGQ